MESIYAAIKYKIIWLFFPIYSISYSIISKIYLPGRILSRNRNFSSFFVWVMDHMQLI